jgi:hypothetical protein
MGRAHAPARSIVTIRERREGTTGEDPQRNVRDLGRDDQLCDGCQIAKIVGIGNNP